MIKNKTSKKEEINIEDRKRMTVVLKCKQETEKIYRDPVSVNSGRDRVSVSSVRVSERNEAQEKEAEEKFRFDLNLIRLYGWEFGIGIYLKKTQKLLWPFKRYWQEAMVLVLLLLVAGTGFFFFQSMKTALGATYTWTQSSWTTLDETATTSHPDSGTWATYSSSTSGLATGTELSLVVASTGSTTQTSDTDFLAGTLDGSATTTGSGDAASVKWLVLGDSCSTDGDCPSNHCVDGVCCDTACDGTCEACDLSGTVGTCTYLPNYEEESGCTAQCYGCSDGSCVPIPIGQQDTYGSATCTATHFRCGGGACTAPTESRCTYGHTYGTGHTICAALGCLSCIGASLNDYCIGAWSCTGQTWWESCACICYKYD